MAKLNKNKRFWGCRKGLRLGDSSVEQAFRTVKAQEFSDTLATTPSAMASPRPGTGSTAPLSSFLYMPTCTRTCARGDKVQIRLLHIKSIRVRDAYWVLLAQTIFDAFTGWSSANHSLSSCQRLLERQCPRPRSRTGNTQFTSVYRPSIVGTSATLTSPTSGEAMLKPGQERERFPLPQLERRTLGNSSPPNAQASCRCCG